MANFTRKKVYRIPMVSPRIQHSRGSEGMDNPAFESSQFASTTKKKMNHLNFDSSETMPNDRDDYCTYTISDLPAMHRDARRDEAIQFRHQYLYGTTMDRKTCIWSCDGESWLDKSSGITWVGVRGMDSICVVSRTGDLDIKRLRRNLKKHTIESFLHHFRKTIIVELEDLEDPYSKLRRDFEDPPNKLRQSQCIKKPFGIVSVGTDEVDKESGHEVNFDEEDEYVNRLLVACKRMRARRAQKRIQKVRPYSLPTPAQHDEKDINETVQVSYDECEENKYVNHVLEACKSMPVRHIQIVDQYSLPTPAQHDEKDTIKFLQERMETDTTFTINETVQTLEHDEKKAIKFLRKKMESDVAFTMDETIQAAISVFQHLFRKKFKANEIGVTVMDPEYNVFMHVAKHKDVNAKELEIHDIEKHLAVINRGSSSSRQPTIASCEEDDDLDEMIRV